MPTSMSKLARAVVLAALVAAMNLAGITAVAQAHTRNDPASMGHRSQEQSTADLSLRRLLAQERFAVPTAAHPRLLLEEERSSLLNLPEDAPDQVASPAQPAEPSGQPGWLTPALSVLSAVLALVAGVAVMAARRAHRSQRAGQTA